MVLIFSLIAPMSVGAQTESRQDPDEEVWMVEEPVFVEDDRLYVSVRSVADHLLEEAIWHSSSQQLEVVTHTGDRIEFVTGDKEIVMNGETYWMDAAPLMRDNRIWLPARHLAEISHARVHWDRQEELVSFAREPLYEVQKGETLVDISETVGVPLDLLKLRNDEDDVYLVAGDHIKTVVPQVMQQIPDEEELELLARIIQVEAGYEKMEGRIAVGNVILNRVESERFPDTIRDVIYQPNQFPPATNGLMDGVVPDEETVEAARRVLQGEVVAEGALYFYNPANTRSSFFTSRPLVTEIGNHRFVK